jgi:hypothetical protein
MTKKKITIYLTDEEHQTIADFSKEIHGTFTTAGVILIKIGLMSIKVGQSKKFLEYFEANRKDIENAVEL